MSRPARSTPAGRVYLDLQRRARGEGRGTQELLLPALLGGDPVRVLGYPIETVLAEKVATAIDLGPANTRVRDYVDVYTLVTTHDVEHGPVRAALIETCKFRATRVVPLSTVIGDFVSLRARAFESYRRDLGPYGDRLPESCAGLVEHVVRFADQLAAEHPTATQWSAAAGRWGA